MSKFNKLCSLTICRLLHVNYTSIKLLNKSVCGCVAGGGKGVGNKVSEMTKKWNYPSILISKGGNHAKSE